ncbi:Spore protein SP21 [Novipirellula aureliae]|uniref:Spore protein SP21 n=1 Tax=Novipirellula aureliae TaxID=2527966 RepID=A0A5C6E694_9BACT|nr:Hsp20/alpha crystallin family protein [Novipirellula aureliae]TWU43487.1 Spore protein SP21 [Novipirellula aureliae]
MFKSLVPQRKTGETELAKTRPTSELARFRTTFDRMLSDFWNSDTDDLWDSQWGYDVQDSENELVVRAEAPGFEPEEIDVQLSGNRLVVQASHRSESKSDTGTSSSYGRVYRSMTVPDGIEADNIQATYKNGVLEVHLPKGEQAKAKRIAVHS